MAKKGGIDPKPLLERAAEDVGLTDGLTDADAGVLLAWLRGKIATLCDTAKNPGAAEEEYRRLATRVRTISKTVSAWCDFGDESEARAWHSQLELAESLDRLPKDAAAAVKHLLQAEDARHA